jgi:hypothetical protein
MGSILQARSDKQGVERLVLALGAKVNILPDTVYNGRMLSSEKPAPTFSQHAPDQRGVLTP